MLKELVKYFVSMIVDNPQVIIVTQIENAGKQIIEVRVAPQDLSKVIGKEGRTFKALRSFVQSVSTGAVNDIVVDVILQ